MKTIKMSQFGNRDVFHLSNEEIPQPQEGGVRIQIKAAGFNPVDWKIREGWYGGDPHQIIGLDCSGVIDAVGPNETNFKIGDEVYAVAFNSSNGTYAQYSCIPAEFVAKKPKNISFEAAAAIPLASMTAFRATTTCSAFKKEDTVFAAGIGGGVGNFAFQFLKHLGIEKIYTVAKNSQSKDFITGELGIPQDHILIYEDLSQEDLREKILLMNDGQFFDATLDLVGGDPKKLCLELTGYSGHFSTIVPEENFIFSIWEENSIPRGRNLSIHQVAIGAELSDPTKKSWSIYTHHLRTISRMLEEEALQPPPIQTVGPLSVETVQEAHRLLESGRVKGKLIMINQ